MNNKVRIISHKRIKSLGLDPKDCIKWVKESFSIKERSQLPAKISVHPKGTNFITSMPALLPEEYGLFGVKTVHRISGQTPSLGSDILLYNSLTGDLLAVIDGNWITTMRTGAVATVAIDALKVKSNYTFSFIGLGNTARATAVCLAEYYSDKNIVFRLKAYKDYADSFIGRLNGYSNLHFEIVNDDEEFFSAGGTIISSITDAKGLLCPNDDLFVSGTLLVPIHTRGFQNCDLSFDKIFGDDTNHIKGFGNFSRFRYFNEVSEVITGKCNGRDSEKERIISYNIGLGLHDVLFAGKIFDVLKDASCESFTQDKETSQFWF